MSSSYVLAVRIPMVMNTTIYKQRGNLLAYALLTALALLAILLKLG